MSKFEVGKSYEPYGSEYDPIKIIRRTVKTVWVDNGNTQWRMRVKTDEDGNEYVADSSVPLNWRDTFTYNAKWEVKGEENMSLEWKPILNSLEWEIYGSYSRKNSPPLPVWQTVLWEKDGVKQLCRVQFREQERKFMVYFDTDEHSFHREEVIYADDYWKAHKQFYHTEWVNYEDIADVIERFKEKAYASAND